MRRVVSKFLSKKRKSRDPDINIFEQLLSKYTYITFDDIDRPIETDDVDFKIVLI